MSAADPALVREVLRDVLAELLPELMAESNTARPAMTPPPPLASVHRPSTWHGGVEAISLADDAELAAFAQRLAQRCESPSERAAIRSGALRFTLVSGSATVGAAGVRRIDHGAVTERLVREAAASGGSILLGPKAVLTPLARDVARTLGVTIEKEKRC